MTVVVLGVLGQHGCGMPLADDQDAIEEFATNRADEAFGDRVGPRRPHGVLMASMSMAVKTASTAAVNYEEDVEPVQGNRVEVEQVAGEDAVGLRSQELRPAVRLGVVPGRSRRR